MVLESVRRVCLCLDTIKLREKIVDIYKAAISIHFTLNTVASVLNDFVLASLYSTVHFFVVQLRWDEQVCGDQTESKIEPRLSCESLSQSAIESVSEVDAEILTHKWQSRYLYKSL